MIPYPSSPASASALKYTHTTFLKPFRRQYVPLHELQPLVLPPPRQQTAVHVAGQRRVEPGDGGRSEPPVLPVGERDEVLGGHEVPQVEHCCCK